MAPSGASTRRVSSRREVVNILSAAAVVILSALPILGAHRIVSQQHKEVSPGQLTVLELLESIPLDVHRSVNPHLQSSDSRRRRMAEVEPRPLRIRPIFQLDGLDRGLTSFLEDVLLPATIDALGEVIKVKLPVEGNLVLPRLCSTYYVASNGRRYPDRCGQVLPLSTCGPFAREDRNVYGPYMTCPYSFYDCTTTPGGDGAPNTDFILYVTAVDSASCFDGTVATGGFCSLDLETGRPLAGFANFCPRSISGDPSKFGSQLDTAVHEILHGIVMSNELYKNYIDVSGEPYRNSPTVIGPTGHKTVVTPRVQQEVRRHFDCPSALGAPVEDGGGDGTMSSHWESSYFENEIMQGASTQRNRQLLSKLTLALLDDSGWYVTDRAAGADLAYGYKKGCSFLTESCAKATLPEQFNNYFCPITVGEDLQIRADSSTDTCSWDHRAIAYCSGSSRLTGNCRQVVGYSNGICGDPANAASRVRSMDFGESWGQANSRCLPVVSPQVRIRSGRSVFTMSNSGASCWDVRCETGNSGQQEVILRVQGVDVVCPAGETVDLSTLGTNIVEGTIGPCPRPQDICAFTGCPSNCNGNGACVGGKCQCYLGYSGWSCEHSVCGATGGDDVCQHLHGANAVCNQSIGLCECVRGTDCDIGREYKMAAPATPAAPTPAPAPGPDPSSSWTPVQLETRQPVQPPATRPSPAINQVPSPPAEDPRIPIDITLESCASGGPCRSVALAGRAYSSDGYQKDCTVYVEVDGLPGRAAADQSAQTDAKGMFSMIAPTMAHTLVELPGGGSCRASFTTTAPVLALSSPPGFAILNPATTLAMAIISNHRSNLGAEAAQLMVATGLNLPAISRVFTHDIVSQIALGGKAYQNNEAVEEAAFVGMSNFANGVIIGSAWLARRADALHQRIQASNAIVNATAAIISESGGLDFTNESEIISVLKAASQLLPSPPFIRVAEGGAATEEVIEAVAASIATINGIAKEMMRDFNGGEFLRKMAALARVVAWDGSLQASRLVIGSPHQLRNFTASMSVEELRQLIASSEDAAPQGELAEDVPSPPPPPEAGPSLPMGKDILNKLEAAWQYSLDRPWILSMSAAGVGIVLVLLLACCCWCCYETPRGGREEKPRRSRYLWRRSHSSSDSGGANDADIIDAMRLSRALQLSMQSAPPAHRQGSQGYPLPSRPSAPALPR
eukprot:jgi/Tetstr1/435215/TSEL_024134.t1